MSIFTTEKFTIITTADPECVWDAITETGHCVPHFYGLAVHSTWRTGDTLTIAVPDGEQLTGRVLHADPSRRLSYTFQSGPGQPSVYVTWEIEDRSDRTTVRLYIDEPSPTDRTDIELVWTPVLAVIEQRLQTCNRQADGTPEALTPDE